MKAIVSYTQMPGQGSKLQKSFDEFLSGRQEALTPLLQLAAAFDYIFRLAQKPPAALVTSRPVDRESLEECRLEAEYQTAHYSSVNAHRDVVDKALVCDYNVALVVMYK